MNLPEPDFKSYSEAKPFPNAVFDGVFTPYVLNEVLDTWPKGGWNQLNSSSQQIKKRGIQDIASVSSITEHLINLLNGQEFIIWLEKLTGINGIIPDPMLIGGGLHETFTGGKLLTHVDFNKHPHTNLDRRINVLLFLNKGWMPSWKGNFELYDHNDLSKPVVSIAPILGRMAIFNTTSFSYHGHPDPLNCPLTTSRKSIAMYYYTNGRPENEQYQKHTTIFKARNRKEKWDGFKDTLRRLVPPIVYDQYKIKKTPKGL